ncbi:phospholipid scramblase 1-like [Contarinia nasturtii]|uniref:phospholipid scramblase 1-like n=1 Tax=Contarinia nasturtii TaxID=265458 RepID=UPI0012D378F2|nr:phospholipid scramblase 1-like [Contarinia nasturtii]
MERNSSAIPSGILINRRNPTHPSNIDYETSSPVTFQPQQSRISSGRHVPPGLEYLTNVNRLILKRSAHYCSSRNVEFSIQNESKEDVYLGVEEDKSDGCFTFGCGLLGMTISDLRGNEVLHFSRASSCGGHLTMEVKIPFGAVIAHVEQQSIMSTNKFIVKNHKGETVLRIKTKSSGRKFKILTLEGNQVGLIERLAYDKIFFPKFTFMDVTFDMNLSVQMKAALMAASHLIVN